MTTGLPFDDFRELLKNLPPLDAAAREATARRSALLGGQGVGLGRIGEIAEWLAAVSAKPQPQITRPLVALFAGTHGVAAHGISQRLTEETQAMVEFCAAGGAAINQVCAAHDLGLKVFDLALHLPVADITQDAALDERGCAATMAFGMEAIAGGADLVCVGDLGVGNETVASALLFALFGGNAADWVVPAADADMTARRLAVVTRAVEFHGANLRDPLEALRRIGGREFAAIAGAILAARMQKVAVILDGMVATSAAAVLHLAQPGAIDHCLLGHVSSSAAHRRAADRLGLKPLLDFSIGEGEGLGAAMAAGVVKTAAAVHSGIVARTH